jgi:S-adenosylmethionine:tRNA ribosyltransferase-isomerase
MKTSDFDYKLSPEFIAQTPIEPRDKSRLMVLHRNTGSIEHRSFLDIVNYLESGDTIVFNDSRVIPARLSGQKGAAIIEILLLRRVGNGIWETLVRPGKKAKEGTMVTVIPESGETDPKLSIEIIEQKEDGIRLVQVSDESLLEKMGKVPLPPYIHTSLAEPERYQTVYSKVKGSVAAPTAGLHFTPNLLSLIQQKGINITFVTLHIGLDTFQPVRVEQPKAHPIHKEYGNLNKETADLLNKTKKAGKRVFAVGTSTIRLLEASSQTGTFQPLSDWVDLFILPGYAFQATDALITNFHLPKSTLLMLVSAFATRELIFKAYEEAKDQHYRFYSFGDAMLIL